MAEKRTRSLPSVRCTESLEISLMRSAARDGRELSDYIRRVLELHQFGHDAECTEPADPERADRASQCDARLPRCG